MSFVPENADKSETSSHSLSKDIFLQLGQVRSAAYSEGVFRLEDIAQRGNDLRKHQNKLGFWTYDNVTRSGSKAVGLVDDPIGGGTKECIIWSINHYLGLNRHPDVIKAARDALITFGTGCGTSAMGGGHSTLHKTVEKKLANWLGKEAAILFPTGYSANLGAISALARGRSTFVLFDRECHASIIDGIKLAGAKFLPFKHNDVEDLEAKIVRLGGEYENILVIVESRYSMSGDIGPLQALARLKKKYRFLLFVDEAHSFGLMPERSLCNALKVTNDVDFIMTTLSKSVASIGGVVATSEPFRTFLQIEATAYILQAAIPPSDAATIIEAMNVIEREPELLTILSEKTLYMRKKLRSAGFDLGKSSGPIIPVFVKNSETLLQMGRDLFERGIFVTPVVYPAVKHSEVRFRFILNVSHSYEDIEKTVADLVIVGNRYGLVDSL